MISVHGNTLYAIAIHKNRSITPFLTLWSHFENRTKKTLSILQLLRTCHIQYEAAYMGMKTLIQMLQICNTGPVTIWGIWGKELEINCKKVTAFFSVHV